MMRPNFWTVLAIILISSGGAMLGRALSRSAAQKINRAQLLAGLLSGITSIGIGVTFSMSRTGDSHAEWIRLACILPFAAAIFVEARERSRIKQ